MIYIHGINHNTQHRGRACDPEGASGLEKLVESLCSEKDISIVAEEFSKEACEYSDIETYYGAPENGRPELCSSFCALGPARLENIGLELRTHLPTNPFGVVDRLRRARPVDWHTNGI